MGLDGLVDDGEDFGEDHRVSHLLILSPSIFNEPTADQNRTPKRAMFPMDDNSKVTLTLI